MAVPLESLTAPELWPSLARWKSQGGSGKFPQLPEQDEAPWIILDPKHEGGLKNQMNKTIKNLYIVLSCFLLTSCISNFMGDGAPKIFTKSFSRDAIPRSEPLSEYGNGDERGYYEVRG